jgi:hypothetical protein
MDCLSLSTLISVSLKSTFQDMYCYSCLFSGAIGLVNLPGFHPKPEFVLSMRWSPENNRLLDLPF